jgi:GT2 family glycosyltransferase
VVTGPRLRRSGPPIEGFDQQQRYGLVTRLLDRLLGESGRPVRVLEVGSNVINLLPRFFDPDQVKVTRCDLLDGDAADPDYVRIEADRPLPFDDDSFDAVVSLEVLEHVPAEKRFGFLGECLRVARRGVIVSCPDGRPDVEYAERVANAAFEVRHGRPHPFLIEHRDCGLPREAEVRGLLLELGAPHAVFPNSPLDLWLGRMVFDEHQAEHPDRRRAALTGYDWGLLPGGARPYRKVYVAVKAFDAGEALDPLPDEWFATPAEPVVHAPTDPVAATAALVNRMADDTTAAFAAAHDEAVKEFAAAADRANRARVEAVQKAQEEIHRTIDTRRTTELRLHVVESALTSVLRSPWRRPFAPFRRLKQWVRPARFDAASLLPWMNLVATDEGGWRATGHDPYFAVPCHMPAGWVRVRLKLTRLGEDRPRKQHLELSADLGGGFLADTCLLRCTWFGDLDEDAYLCLPAAALAFRLDPMDGDGEFRIDEFRVESVTGPRAWAAAAGRKLGLLRQYQCTLPAIGRGLADLFRGRFGKLRKKLFQGFHDDRILAPVGTSAQELYAEWRAKRALTDADRDALRAEADALADPPVISVLMPVCDPPVECLKKAIDSVRRQTYPHWQLCIADDASTNPAVKALLREASAADPRIRVTFRPTRGGISHASNDALALAAGGHVALLDHDDELAEHALSLVAREVVAHPAADFLYTDEDKIEPDGRHVDPFLKPDWSPEFFLSCMYTCHLGVYRTELVRRVGGFRPEFDLAQDYDLAFRVLAEIEKTAEQDFDGHTVRPPHADRIRHVKDVLYHWRKLPTSTAAGHEAKPKAEGVARKAVAAYLAATGRDATVEPGPTPGYHRVRHRIAGRPRVSVVIPTAGKPATIRGAASSYVGHCVDSIRRLSTYEHYEIVVVDNGDLTPALAAELDRAGVRRVRYEADGPFNLAAKMNLGATAAAGDVLVFLNDDTEVISPDWIEAMLEFAQQPGVGAVGAKLLFPDGRLQHVGVTLLEGRPGHPYYQFPGTYPGYFNGGLVPRNYSAVTGACVMVRADVFRSVGGFDPAFRLNYNDVDLCLRIAAAGKRVVWTPYAALYHFESVSKEGVLPGELEAFLERWVKHLPTDPYYHPLLTMHYHDYRLGDAG